MTLDLDINLSRILEHIARNMSAGDWSGDPEETYILGLDSLVDTLLSEGRSTARGLCQVEKPESLRFPDNTALNPEDVGRLYERLRGFRLHLTRSKDPKLVPCIKGKRNQGLFYTPSTIVKYIVERTLDCLGISDPAEYLNLRVLDPTVGTGIFLLEALEQISGRVQNVKGNAGIESAIAEVKKTIKDRVGARGPELDRKVLMRIHIVEKCLFGVDLDPTAVKIARAALSNRVCGRHSEYEIMPNILCGNSLKGDVGNNYILQSDDGPKRRHASVLQPPVVDEQDFFHWPAKFPQVFSDSGNGFNCVIGNPPYEILSVKESGLQTRRDEQVYFRRFFSSCSGKINTYRLMIERALQLLKEGGALGFIVPATLLGDSTAEKLRRMILDQTTVFRSLVIPEKAKVFPGVTQALLVLVTRKCGVTDKIEPNFWNGTGPIIESTQVTITRSMIAAAGFRVPLITSRKELELLEAVSRFPPLGGNSEFQRVGRIHQGEVNLTVHRDFITAEKTGYPLVRGEHVNPLRVNHPAENGNRLDWVLPRFLDQPHGKNKRPASSLPGSRGRAWERARIVLARVVNMDTERRLKAASVGPGVFLGDMTNFISELNLPVNYLLGLLNSRMLNWRIKLTSTNNYISAAEVEALPVPRLSDAGLPPKTIMSARQIFGKWIVGQDASVAEFVQEVSGMAKSMDGESSRAILGKMIEWVVDEIQESDGSHGVSVLWNLLDSLVVVLYGAESMVEVLTGN